MTDRRVTRRRLLAAGVASAGATALTGTGGASGHAVEDVVVESHDGTDLTATVYRPAGASADDPVPMILHSHGWSGSRTTSQDAFAAERDRGFGVLSFDQRGHGDSGGEAHVQDPEREGRDVIAVLDHVADLPWVARSRGRTVGTSERTTAGRADDPMVFAMGGSYGGAYQLVGALTETSRRGYTRFDALAPEITWFDLSESLAPQGVVRSAWIAALYAMGAGNVPDYVHEAFAWGTATGQWPDGDQPGEPDVDSRFSRNGPSGFVQEGVRLDVPALFGQGLSDNLFNLNQAWHNFERALSERARQHSAVVGYNGGHALPNAYPPGEPLAAELGTHQGACADDSFADLRLRFFEGVRDGTADARDLVGSAYAMTTVDGDRCLRVDALDDRVTLFAAAHVEVALDGDGGLEATSVSGGDAAIAPVDGFPGEVPFDIDRVDDGAVGATTEAPAGAGDPTGTHPLPSVAASPTGVGPPIHLDLAGGPLTVAGVPTFTADVTTAGVEQRLFAGLSVGERPSDATVVHNNVLPLREPEPVDGVKRTIELPGVAVEVPFGERLYLTLSATSDVSFAHGSARTPGAVVLEGLRVDVPLA